MSAVARPLFTVPWRHLCLVPLQALSHLRCTIIGCVCILFGALAFQHQDVQAFLGIALPGSFTNKPDIVRHSSDSCTCLAADRDPAPCLLLP